MQHVLVAPFHQGEQHQRRDTAVAGADGRRGRAYRPYGGTVRGRIRSGGVAPLRVSAHAERGRSGRGGGAGGPRQRVAVEFQLVAQRPAAQLAGVK